MYKDRCIPATAEAQIGGITVWGQPQAEIGQTLFQQIS
jgi:hypothetical protein